MGEGGQKVKGKNVVDVKQDKFWIIFKILTLYTYVLNMLMYMTYVYT